MKLLMLIGLAGAIASTHVVAAQEQRWALAIGNDQYQHANHLANAGNDALAVGEELLKRGYKTTIKLNLNRSGLIDVIENFSNQIHSGDDVVFYYAGHGLQVDGENILVPVDFDAARPEDALLKGYSLSKTLEHLIAHGAATRIIILDSCRDNPFLTQRSLKGGWATMGTSAGTLIAFGTSPGSTAADNPGKDHGLFTEKLLERFGSPTDIERTLQLVRQDVMVASEGRQVPWVASSLMGEFHLDPANDRGVPLVPAFDLGFPGQRVSSTSPSYSSESGRSLVQDGATLSSSPSSSQPPPQSIPIAVSSNPNGDPSLTQSTSQASDRQGTLTLQQERVLIEEAIRLAEVGAFDDSVRSLHAVLEADPSSSLALRILGLVFHLMGRSVVADQTLSRAITLNPHDAEAFYYRCMVNAASNYSAAVHDCEVAISLNPTNKNTRLILAIASLDHGNALDAEKQVEEIIALDPNNQLAASIHGKVLMRLGRLSSAEAEFRRAMEDGQDVNKTDY